MCNIKIGGHRLDAVTVLAQWHLHSALSESAAARSTYVGCRGCSVPQVLDVKVLASWQLHIALPALQAPGSNLTDIRAGQQSEQKIRPSLPPGPWVLETQRRFPCAAKRER